MSRTEISTLGEFGLIRRLTEKFPILNSSTLKGVGDDAAVLDFGTKQVLVTTDLLLEGVHFDLVYVPLKHLGYKAAVVNFSDIYAMNGRPKQITVSLGVSKRFSVEDLEQIYDGLSLACKHYGVDLVGGDTSASLTGLTLSITCIGEADKDKIVQKIVPVELMNYALLQGESMEQLVAKICLLLIKNLQKIWHVNLV